jgi:hypothetical protein
MGLPDDWNAWRLRRFPSEVSAASDIGFDLREIDTYAAGCLDTYFSRGRLDPERIRVLERCLKHLEPLLPALPEPVSGYFRQLETLCRAVLGAIGRLH